MLNVLKAGLKKTQEYLSSGFKKIFFNPNSKDLFLDLEALLLQADLGISTTEKIILKIKNKLSHQQLNDPETVHHTLCNILLEILKPCEQPLVTTPNDKPTVVLLVGVNGAGKTTTIAKLANIYKHIGMQPVLACGDTFRAAAIEQLSSWGEKLEIPVIKKTIGADPAATIFDAYNFTVANNQKILLADTAGRLHTKKNLMDELKKITKVLKKVDPNAPHEIMLVLDASIGQNSLNQVKTFHGSIGITSLAITKLDGTAKAGIIFAIADLYNIPIRYISYGEKITDIKVFQAKEFINALFK